jgi:hypothetical protein
LADGDRNLPRPSHSPCSPLYIRNIRTFLQHEIGEFAKQLLDSDAYFHARQIGADAAMDTEIKCGVAVLGPIEHDPIRAGNSAGSRLAAP